MAREIRRRFDIPHRQVIVDVEDSFGHVSSHSIPLTSDTCHLCGSTLPGTSGSSNVNASAVAIVAHVHDLEPDLIAKLEAAAQGDQELLKVVQAAKAKRDGHASSSSR